MSLLDGICQPNDIKKIEFAQLDELAAEIRSFMLEHVAETGGHLASNLGAVELTIALHRVLKFPEDKLIWDVGHQSYVHKILTGRKDGFDTLRQLNGISGFPKRCESSCDSFDTGHSSTSISAGVGIAAARDLRGEHFQVVSVIGDGAMTGGLAYEALNNASRLNTNFMIVLNDNQMSISKNVGGVSTHLASMRTAASYQEFKSDVHNRLEKTPYGERVARRIHNAKESLKQLLIPGMIFENMGITYLGPVDGHDIPGMIRIFNEAKRVSGPVVVHVLTKKGKGYAPAEIHPDRFHGTPAFDLATGKPLKKKEKPSYTDVFSTVISNIAREEPDVVAITAAMTDGTGLKQFEAEFPDRFFDVGIAEGHGVTFAAGLAVGGMRPVFAVYSSFLQRGFDELVEDVCMQDLPVVFAVDRAGLVGADGETHQGLLDLSYLTMIPNMTVMAPKNAWELADMLRFALTLGHPAAVRYPRGTAYDGLQSYREPVRLGRSEVIRRGSEVALLAVGAMVEVAEAVVRDLMDAGLSPTFVNARFVKPIDQEMLSGLAVDHKLIVTMEENQLTGGFGEMVSSYLELQNAGVKTLEFGVRDRFVPQGSVEEQRKLLGIDRASVTRDILEEYRRIEREA